MFVERGSTNAWASKTSPGVMYVVRPNTVPSASYQVNIYAIGKV